MTHYQSACLWVIAQAVCRLAGADCPIPAPTQEWTNELLALAVEDAEKTPQSAADALLDEMGEWEY